MTREQKKPKEVKPTCMALCAGCETALRLTYWIIEEQRERVENCGLCGRFGIVRSCALSPKIRQIYSPRTGGGERNRAGRL